MISAIWWFESSASNFREMMSCSRWGNSRTRRATSLCSSRARTSVSMDVVAGDISRMTSGSTIVSRLCLRALLMIALRAIVKSQVE